MLNLKKVTTPEEIIFNERLKGEKQIAYIRLVLLLILLIATIVLVFNEPAEGVSEEDVIRSRISQFSTMFFAIAVTVITLLLFRRKKYSLLMSYLLIAHDMLLLCFVTYIMSMESPSLALTAFITTLYSLFIILSGKRYSFRISIYSGGLAVLCYIGVILLNVTDIVRPFGVTNPVFTGIGNSGVQNLVYFDIDDIVIRCVIYILIGIVTGLLAKDNRRLIVSQRNLFIENTNLERTFVSNFTKTIESNLKTSDSLKNSVELMSEKFWDMFISLNKISKNSRTQVQLITDSVGAMEGINTSFDKIESSVEDQAIQIKSAFEKINDLIENINKINQSSLSTKEMSSQLTKIAYNGSKAVEESILAIKEIEKSSEEIKIASNLINEIAELTNILSMNANIEAANAGVIGKGFSVVANEVRKLASDSSDSVKTINDAITNMLEKIKKGVTMSEKVGVILTNIITGIETTNQLINSISEFTKSQSTSSSLIENSMSELIIKTGIIGHSITQERNTTSEIVNKAKSIKELALTTDDEVTKEVESGKSIKSAIEEITNASKENRNLASSLKEDLKAYQQKEIK